MDLETLCEMKDLLSQRILKLNLLISDMEERIEKLVQEDKSSNTNLIISEKEILEQVKDNLMRTKISEEVCYEMIDECNVVKENQELMELNQEAEEREELLYSYINNPSIGPKN